MYSPVPARSADFCNSNVYAYATETSAIPINGTTYTSPSVYITYNNIEYISAFSSGEVSSSTTFKLESLVVSVDPWDVSTDPPQLLTVADALTKPATQETHQLTRPVPITAEPPAPSKPGPAPAVPTMSAGPDPRPTSGILPGLPSKDDPLVDNGNEPSIPVGSKNEHPSHTPDGDGQPPSQPPATSPVNSPDGPQQGPPPERAPDPRPVHDSISPSGTGNAAAAPIAESSRGIGGFIASMIAQPPFQGNIGSTKPEQNGINEVEPCITQRRGGC
ncbi:hypothetical protein B9Z65_5436 [Elsinoe australis]|uniref:Uncharacterized protein n=1 Tax=Elsinoe australis TaxID=40998 RepID=A0A2P7ZE21_9PEZI|nr:hypothetical protein B9Z65_5436 [Elsinoe australis]